jgi:AcrR family transcriptional regulator
MSLYNHVTNKADLVDAMLDLVLTDLLAEVEPSSAAIGASDWIAALRARILIARRVMLRHRWVPGLIEARNQLIAPLVAYYEGVLATLTAGGFSYDLSHHTLHALGTRALGFSQELFDPGQGSDADLPPEVAARFLTEFPHLAAMMAGVAHDDPESTLGWCDDQTEFEFGLDVLLDGIERRRASDLADGSGSPG